MKSNTAKEIGAESVRNVRPWVWVALGVVLLFSTSVRLRLLKAPLERDEGEYAYAGQLICEGVAPYGHVYNMKMPGIYAAYALMLSVFGQTAWGIHLGLAIINATTIVLVFFLTARIFGQIAGLVAGCAFAILSLGRWVQGVFANAEHFVIFFALAGILMLLVAEEKQCLYALFIGAILLGISAIMKQHGAAFILFGAIFVVISQRSVKPASNKRLFRWGVVFSVGVIIPFCITCLILWKAGVFGKFWFWTFDYAGKYVSAVPFEGGVLYLKRQFMRLAGSAVGLWGLAGVGLAGLLCSAKLDKPRLFAGGFILFSFLAVCPGLYFRPHYFILFLPAVSMSAGIGAICIRSLCARIKPAFLAGAIPILLVAAAPVYAICQQKALFFDLTPAKASRFVFGLNPFPESEKIGEYIKEHSEKDDRIAVIGSEPQLYFYSQRRSATGHIYTYALMEEHDYALPMQEEMIREIELAEPKFMVFVNIDKSWLVRENSERKIFQWFDDYKRKYDRVGMVEMLDYNNTLYLWGPEAACYEPRATHWIQVFRKKQAK